MSKIKEHFRRNADRYIVGVSTGVVIAGITYIIMRSCTPLHSNGALSPLHSNGQGQSFNISAGNDVSNVGNVTHVNFGGHTHKLVRDNSTGKVWETVGEAATDIDVNRVTLSRHLNGHIPHIKGKTYSIAGIGTKE